MKKWRGEVCTRQGRKKSAHESAAACGLPASFSALQTQILFGVNCIPTNAYVEALTHSSSECDNIRDAAFKEGFKLEEISKLGANTI